MLKLESALVLGNLEGITVSCSLRNHRVIIFILKNRVDRRRVALED